MEHFFSHFKDLGPWALTGAVSILAKILHSVKKSMDSFAETRVKADLAYKEASERVPEIKASYETWLAHRKTF